MLVEQMVAQSVSTLEAMKRERGRLVLAFLTWTIRDMPNRMDAGPGATAYRFQKLGRVISDVYEVVYGKVPAPFGWIRRPLPDRAALIIMPWWLDLLERGWWKIRQRWL